MNARTDEDRVMEALPAIAKLIEIVERDLPEKDREALFSLLDQLAESAEKACKSVDRMLANEEASSKRMALMEERRSKEAPWAI